jgi:GxxExxY protein
LHDGRSMHGDAMTALNELTSPLIGAAIEVHRRLGPGLLESVYFECLLIELARTGLQIETQRRVPVVYRGIPLRTSFRIDLLVEQQVILEVKAIDRILPVHQAQLLTYLKLTGCPAGLLLNFNVPALKDGIKRVLNLRKEAGRAAGPSGPATGLG